MSAGFYIHIPFCRQACRYCDFHFSVSVHQKSDMIKAIRKEIIEKSMSFSGMEFGTLYFGGGTPSVLNANELKELIETVTKFFTCKTDFEISLEANPDDLSPAYLRDLKSAGIQRLSIGIQSFRDEDLKLMRRSHNSKQAEEAILNAQDAGFKDINGDLIYGFPGLKEEAWRDNLRKLLELKIQHISAYHLTFEAGTVFDHWRKKGKIFPVEEEESLDQFKILKEETQKEGFVHYEISNFALPGFFSKHNSVYWKNENYIGVGPSAHSYNGKERFWNIRSNKKYMENLEKGGGKYYEKETLSTDDKYNEYILTSLRTIWGIDLDKIRSAFGNNYVKYTEEVAKKLLDKDHLSINNQNIIISEKGMFLSDQIMREFIKV